MRGIPDWLIDVSVWLCKMLGGPAGFSLCAWFYQLRLFGHPMGEPLVRTADTILFWDKGHCRKAWLLRRRGTW